MLFSFFMSLLAYSTFRSATGDTRPLPLLFFALRGCDTSTAVLPPGTSKQASNSVAVSEADQRPQTISPFQLYIMVIYLVESVRKSIRLAILTHYGKSESLLYCQFSLTRRNAHSILSGFSVSYICVRLRSRDYFADAINYWLYPKALCAL